MILAELPAVVPDVGLVASVIVALAGAVAVLYRLFRRAVVDIVSELLAPIHEQLRPNGGTSLRDRVDRIETKVDTLTSRRRWRPWP